jgi:hypothetical protein
LRLDKRDALLFAPSNQSSDGSGGQVEAEDAGAPSVPIALPKVGDVGVLIRIRIVVLRDL